MNYNLVRENYEQARARYMMARQSEDHREYNDAWAVFVKARAELHAIVEAL